MLCLLNATSERMHNITLLCSGEEHLERCSSVFLGTPCNVSDASRTRNEERDLIERPMES
jgi:hypothetical protein